MHGVGEWISPSHLIINSPLPIHLLPYPVPRVELPETAVNKQSADMNSSIRLLLPLFLFAGPSPANPLADRQRGQSSENGAQLVDYKMQFSAIVRAN